MIKKLFYLKWLCCLFLMASTATYAQNALSFDGANDYIATAYPGVLGSAPRTVEAWVKPTATGENVVVDWGSEVTNGFRFTVRLETSGVISRVRVENKGNSLIDDVSGGTNLADGNWHHIAVTFDNSLATTEKCKIFVDGVLKKQGNLASTVTTASVNLQIGKRVTLSSGYFNGSIDDVRVWDVARTQAEILADMNTEFCTIPANLKANFKFNQGIAGGDNTAITSLAESVSGNDGTFMAFALNGATSNFVTGAALASGPPNATVTLTGTTLTVNTITGATYQWVDCGNANLPITGATATTFTPTFSGSFAVIISAPGACTATSTCTPVTVTGCNINPTLSINGGTLTALQTGATYQWVDTDNANAPVVGATTQSFTPTVSGHYAVIITTPDTCTVTSSSILMCAINSAVTLSGTTLTATLAGASYQWINCTGNVAVAGATSQSFTPTVDGSYSVKITVLGTCIATSACTQVTLPLLPNGLNFDGISDYVSTNYVGISGGGARTVEAWVKIPTNALQRFIVDWGTSTASTTAANKFALNVSTTGKLRFDVTTGSNITGTISIDDGNWHHVAVTYDPAATNKVILYVDGIQDAIGNPSVTVNTSTTNKVRIGYGVGSAGYFKGEMDEVRIWDVARTQAEIAGAKDTELCVMPSSLKAYYKFNKGVPGGLNTGQNVAPDSADINNGTLNGFALTGATSNWVAGAPLSGAPTATVTLAGTTLSVNATTGATYQWVDCANANAPVASATAVDFTPAVSGSYAVIVTGSNGCSATSACTQVSLCSVDATVTLLGTTLTATQTGATYQWVDCANANAPVSGAISATFTPTASGNYAVIITMPNSCTATSACTQVTVCSVNPAVTLAGTTLTATQTGATYQWVDCANANAPVSGATSATFTPTASGNYAVIITENTCTATSACTQVTVCTLTATTTLAGTTLTANTVVGATYQWVDCANANASIAGATTATYTATITGNYAVVITENNCTVTSACTQVTIAVPAVQNGLNFDGVDDYVQTNYDGVLGNTARTVEAWIKVPVANTTGQKVIADWGALSPNGSRFTLCVNSNFIRIEAGGSGLSGTLALNDNQWHHVAVTYNPSATTKVILYVDGVQNAAGNFTLTPNTSTSVNLRIGRRVDDLNYFLGSIDEVRVWDVVRTAAEISANKNSEFCTLPSGLKAYYKFNEGIAAGSNPGITTTADSAGTNPGTLFTFGLTGIASNWIAGPTAVLQTDVPTATTTLAGTTLTANTVTGATYQWLDCGNANASIASATATTFTPTASGSYAVKITTSGGCSATSACTQVTLASCTLTATTTLAGTTLTANTVTGATYQWVDCANANAPISGATLATFTPSASGNYAVVITENTCTATSACTQVTICNVNNAVTLAGSTLTATQTGATYQWVDCTTNTNIVGATAAAYTPTVNGNYKVIITMPNSCTATSACTQVTLVVCNVDATVTLAGTTLTATQTGATYQWVNCTGNTNITGATSSIYTPTVSGNYKVVITMPNTCTATSTCTQVTIPVVTTVQNGLAFDASSDYLSTTYPGISGTGSRTVEAWINVPATNNATRFIAEWGTAGTTGVNKFGLYVTNTKLLQLTVNNSYNFPGGSTIVADGTWHHVAVTFDNSLATDKVKLYIDGVLSTSGNPTTAIDTGTANNMLIGRGLTGSGFFNGTMDELRVWNVARTQAELQANMNTEFCTIPSNLVAYYNFNQGVAGGTNTSITSLINSAGTGNGSFQTFAKTGTTSNFVTGVPGVAAGVVPTATVTLAGITLTANAVTGATYQWVDCANANAPIAGATATTYTPIANGNYAVVITTPGGCSATSLCTQVTVVCVVDATVTLNGTTLTATQTGATYQWVDCANANAPISGATAASFTPLITGNYAVIVTMWAGCTATSTCTQVTVVGCTISSAVTLAGTTLTATQTGANYQWVDCANANAPISGATAVSYTPTVSGNYAVIVSAGTCTVTSVCTQITICNVSPAVTLAGTTITATQTGAAYQWVNCTTNLPIAGATAVSYTPTATGNYKVIITMPNSCTATSVCTQVTICALNPAVTLAGTTITAAQTGATYQWVNCATGNTPITGATAISYTPTVTGNYAVIITTAANGCTITSACTQVTICNLNAAVTLLGTTLTATQTGASYQWVDCGTNLPIAGATAVSYTATATGSYKVVITTPDSCTITSTCTQVAVCNLSAIVTLAGTTLTVAQTGANYQWMNCTTGTPVTGANAQTFTPTVTGNYRVIVSTPAGCLVQSTCTQVIICNLNPAVTVVGTTLTATQTGATYQWVDCANANAPIAGATAISYTPTVTGNYAVIITTPADGCTTTSACTPVTVCNLDAAVTLAGTMLTAAQANASYQWMNCADNTAVTGANAQTFIPAVSGSYSVIISTPDNCTITSACTEVFVCNVNAGVNNNGGMLMAIPQAGATYQWINCDNNTPIAGQTGATFTPTVSGNYALMVTIGECSDTSDCQFVLVCNLNDAVLLTGTTLTATQTGASYQWMNCADNTPVTGANAQTFTPTVSGNYSVIISTPNNCTTTSDCYEVEVCVIDNTMVNNGGTLTAMQAGATYQWINCADNNPIEGATGMTFTPTVTGSYAVEITLSGSCIVTSGCEEVEVLSDKSFDFAHTITAFPNPTSGLVTINMNDVYDSVTMTVYNITGQVVSTQAIGDVQTFTTDLSSVARGVYFLDIKTGAGQSTVLKVIRN